MLHFFASALISQSFECVPHSFTPALGLRNQTFRDVSSKSFLLDHIFEIHLIPSLSLSRAQVLTAFQIYARASGFVKDFSPILSYSTRVSHFTNISRVRISHSFTSSPFFATNTSQSLQVHAIIRHLQSSCSETSLLLLSALLIKV